MKIVWVLGSSPEGICNLLPSLTVSFLVFLNFHAVDHCKLHVCLLSSQWPCVAIYFQSVKRRPLHYTCVPSLGSVAVCLNKLHNTTLCLDDNHLSDLLGGKGAVTQCLKTLTKCSSLLFRTLSIINQLLLGHAAFYCSYTDKVTSLSSGS